MLKGAHFLIILQVTFGAKWLRFIVQYSLDSSVLYPNIIYEAQMTSNQLNYKQKIYIGTAETDFKHRFNNLTK